MAFYKNEEQQIQFLKDLININKETKILDLGYGAGTHLTKLQEVSDFVYGYDKETNDKKSPLLPNTRKLNFFEKDWDLKDLDLVYCFAPEYGQDWNNFDQLVAKVSLSLKQGGKFVFDLHKWNSIEIGHTFQEWKFIEKRKIIWLGSCIREEKAFICKRKIIDQNFESKEFTIQWRIFSREEIIEIMHKAGMKLITECYDFDLNQKGSWNPQLNHRRLITIFEKE